MNLKKFLSAVCAAMFVVTLMPSVQAEDEVAVFADVKADNLNFDAIKFLKSEKIVNGYADGNFRGENGINRAEFLKIAMMAAKIDAGSGEDCYKDVKKGDWFAGYVCTATKKGFVKGYSDGNFRAGDQINFAEASKMVVNIMNLTPGEVDGKLWYKQYVTALQDQKAIPASVASFGYKITRGDMAEMIWRIKQKPEGVESISFTTIKNKTLAAETGGALQKFDSCVELKDHLEDISANRSGEMKYMMMNSPTANGSAPTSAAPASMAESANSDSGSPSYSTTNVQVEGVDEADIVKNDAKYVYLLKNNTVRIVEAYPPENMKELSKVTFSDGNFYPADMYVDGDKMVIIGYNQIMLYGDEVQTETSFMPRYRSGSTKIYIYDIKDRSNIKPIRDLSFEGNYISSRKIGQLVYLVVNKPEYRYEFPLSWTEKDVLPLYSDSATKATKPLVGCNQILYSPVENSANYMVVAGVSLSDAGSDISKQVILGSSENIYASKDNLYVAETQNNWFGWAYNPDSQQDQKTLVHKFALNPGEIKYMGKKDVPGHILNQFSMDEFNGNFRIATTVGEVWNDENKSKNNVYVLDGKLNLVGSLTGIAPGEKIYSVRFVGNKAYLVTFKKTDPFFVIDLADASNPRILGELKIPGYSDYLHPFDENHVIGFGKDAVDASSEDVEARNLDFAWYLGMKVAMFDVSDVAHPVELHKITIGDRGTDSPLLNDHKALMFDKEKGIMAFPVSVAQVKEELKADPKTPANTYGTTVFQGAYVYGVSIADGFKFKGSVTHFNDISAGFYGEETVDRILYIGDYLYTVSKAIVMANKSGDLSQVGKVELGE